MNTNMFLNNEHSTEINETISRESNKIVVVSTVKVYQQMDAH